MTVSRGFGSYLQRLSLSVDIVDEHAFAGIKKLVTRYVDEQLNIDYFEVLFEQRGDPGTLTTVWCTVLEREGNSKNVRSDGKYRDQTSYAYGESTRLWVLPNSRDETLERTAVHKDAWCNTASLPAYRSPVDTRSARTSIAVPLKDGDQTVGVMFMESEDYLETTTLAQKELLLLADAVTRLHINRMRTKATTQGTRTALDELDVVLRDGDFPRLTKPKVFVAYPDDSDDEVIDVIKRVLDARKDRIEPVFWREITDPGPITEKIETEIRQAAFGVCYLSQRSADGAEYPYFDNANVLFEAGMMNALSGSSGWIVIREDERQAQTGPAPFDLQSLRQIAVERGPEGLNVGYLVDKLEAMVDGLLGDEAPPATSVTPHAPATPVPPAPPAPSWDAPTTGSAIPTTNA